MSTRKLLSALLAVLVVAVLAVTIFLGVVYARADAEEKARDSALAAANEYVQKMFAWTPENISENITFMMGVLTGNAKAEYERNVLGNRIAETVKSQKMVSTVTDQGSGVITNTRDTAEVLLFINQSASRADTQEIQANPSRVVYSMERRDGRWLVNDVQLITDQTFTDLVDERDGDDGAPRTSIPVTPGESATDPAQEEAPAPAPQVPDAEVPDAGVPTTGAPVPTG